jgi:hypothetical protein
MTETRTVRLARPPLHILHPGVRKRSIALLQFSTRAANILERQHINLIGNLIDAARHGFLVPGAGVQSVAEIKDALDSLADSVDSNGTVDWLRYAVCRRFLILPAKECAQGTKFVQMLPTVIENAVESACGASGRILFRRSLLGDDFGAGTLIGTARDLGFSKQAAFLKKEKILHAIRAAIFRDDYRGSRFRFRPDFVGPLRELKTALDTTRGAALPFTDWNRMVARAFGVDVPLAAPIQNLLLSIFGYQVVRPTGFQATPVVLPKGRSVLAFRDEIQSIAGLLTRDFPAGVTKLQLQREIRRRNRGVVRLSDMPALLGALSFVEHRPKGKIRAQIDHILPTAGLLERIFRAKGLPMNARKLASEMKRLNLTNRPIRSARQISGVLFEDNRFSTIGKTGLWILSEWNHIETRTVADIAAELIRQAARPLTEHELFEHISRVRPVKKDSIVTLLRQNGRFRRTSPCTWELKLRH